MDECGLEVVAVSALLDAERSRAGLGIGLAQSDARFGGAEAEQAVMIPCDELMRIFWLTRGGFEVERHGGEARGSGVGAKGPKRQKGQKGPKGGKSRRRPGWLGRSHIKIRVYNPRQTGIGRSRC